MAAAWRTSLERTLLNVVAEQVSNIIAAHVPVYDGLPANAYHFAVTAPGVSTAPGRLATTEMHHPPDMQSANVGSEVPRVLNIVRPLADTEYRYVAVTESLYLCVLTVDTISCRKLGSA